MSKLTQKLKYKYVSQTAMRDTGDIRKAKRFANQIIATVGRNMRAYPLSKPAHGSSLVAMKTTIVRDLRKRLSLR